jgi:transketolase
MRKIFPQTIYKLMKKDKKIFCLLGDIGVFSFRNIFKSFDDRILNMSTMEQSMIGFASGLARAKYIPIIHSIAPFLVLRALEQIKIDFVYNKLSCNLVSVGGSNDYSKLGSTHHCIEDISILSNYLDINIFLATNSLEFKYLLEKNYNNNSVNYFRITESVREKKIINNRFIKNNNNNNLLIVVGNNVDEFIQENNKLDIYYINKLSRNLNFNFIKNYNKIIIVEPYYGSILERKIRKKNFIKKDILSLGYDETILHKYGSKNEQNEYFKIDKKEIIKKINDFTK